MRESRSPCLDSVKNQQFFDRWLGNARSILRLKNEDPRSAVRRVLPGISTATPFHHLQDSWPTPESKSLGEQIRGDTKPCRMQIASIRGLSTGFEICRQFHVNRMSIRWTTAVAMWTASVIALAGSGTSSNSAAIKSDMAALGTRMGKSRMASNLAAAAVGSPAAHSSKSDCDPYSSYSLRRSHHSRVCNCSAARTGFELGRAIR